MHQGGAQQAIKIGGWLSDPGQKFLKLGLQIRSSSCLEVEPLAPDRAREHLHRGVAAQFADADGPQPIRPVGKQAAVPLVQGGESERLVELAGGGQQHIQQSLHLGGGLRLAIGQSKAKAACDRGAHLARVELFAFDGGGAQGPVWLLPDPGRGYGFRLIASWGEAIRGWFSLHGGGLRCSGRRAGRLQITEHLLHLFQHAAQVFRDFGGNHVGLREVVGSEHAGDS